MTIHDYYTKIPLPSQSNKLDIIACEAQWNYSDTHFLWQFIDPTI